jgi:hypothetical protein
MRCQRITTYGNNGILALFVTALFKNGYSDLRTLRVCSVRPFLRYYGSEVKTTADPKDPVCNSTTDFEIELFSSSLAKTVAGYYQFDQDNVSALSSGGDIGYSGAIHKERIATDAQKMSFLAGVFMRYGRAGNPNDSSRYSIHVPVSFSTAKACVDILKEFGCRNIKETQTIRSEYIAFNASDKIRDLIVLIDNLDAKTLDGTVIAF